MSFAKFRRDSKRRAKATSFGELEVIELPKIKEAIRKTKLKLSKKRHEGTHTSIYLVEGLQKLYGRKNLCLKVFEDSPSIWGSTTFTGRSPIIESTKVQNLMALRGLAPRVYDLIEVEGKTAQVCDYLIGKKKVVPISDPRFTFNQRELTKDYNFIDGKLVDFQAAVFVDYKRTRGELMNRLSRETQFPFGHHGLYQSTPYLDGKRNTKERLKRFGFKGFEGKNVLDVGCNIGMFCQEAIKLGAKRVVGLDTPTIAEIAQELAILDGYFNIDFYGVELKKVTKYSLRKLTGIYRFNIVLFLAMENYIGWPDWVKNCDTLYFEGHGKVRPIKVYTKEELKKVK